MPRTYTLTDESELLALVSGGSQEPSKPAPGEQGSGQWFSARIGKLTASRMAEAMSVLKTGKPSAERKALLMELVTERMTDVISPHYVSPAMQWGIDNEGAAKAAYTAATGRAVKPCSYYDHPEIDNFGASPDGLVDDDGLIECKCPTSRTHLEWMDAGIVPEQHQAQMTVQLMCTGRQWVDFVSYDPRMKAERHRVFIRRFAPTVEYVEQVRAAAVLFLDDLEKLFERLSTQ